jgi:hypothetical protein
MSVKALTWAFDQMTELPVDKLVLLALADFANEAHECWPSRRVLAIRAMCSTDTVDRVLKRLEASGCIKKELRVADRAGKTSSIYTLVGMNGAQHQYVVPKPQIAATPDNSTLAASVPLPLAADCGVPSRTTRGVPSRTDAASLAAQDAATGTVTEPSVEPKKESKSAPRARTPRGARLENDWSPSEDLCQWTRTTFPQSTAESLQREVENFRDYWTSRPGSAACKLDWDATWRVWCRRAFASAPMRPRAGTSAPRQPNRPSLSDIAGAFMRLEDRGVI